MERWNPVRLILAVVLAVAVPGVEWLLGGNPMDALVDAALVALIAWVVLEYWAAAKR